MSTKKIVLISSIIALIVFLTQVTVFVVQPIGTVPKGKTIVILRMNKTSFIDSADAMCARETGGVSLMCRGMMLGAIGNKATILLRLPYSEALYSMSTGGKSYGRKR